MRWGANFCSSPPTGSQHLITFFPPEFPGKERCSIGYRSLVDFLRDLVPNHLITANVDEYPSELCPSRATARALSPGGESRYGAGRVRRSRYLSGSGWKEYQASGSVCGIRLPDGLQESSRLPEPIFTPATKADTGHDINVSFEQAIEKFGAERMNRLRELTLAIYRKAAAYAETRGIIIADTKFEFGYIGDKLILADEVLLRIRPDSGQGISIVPAAPSLLMTSSSFVITWKQSDGTSSLLPPFFRRR